MPIFGEMNERQLLRSKDIMRSERWNLSCTYTISRLLSSSRTVHHTIQYIYIKYIYAIQITITKPSVTISIFLSTQIHCIKSEIRSVA